MTDDNQELDAPAITEKDPSEAFLEAVMEEISDDESAKQPKESQAATEDAVDPGTEGKATDQATPDVEDEEQPKVDLSWAPAEIQETLTDIDPDVLAGLVPSLRKSHRLMQGDYTRKTQALAEQRKELEALTKENKDLIAIGRTTLTHPEAKQLFAEIVAGNVEAIDDEDKPLTRNDVESVVRGEKEKEAKELESFELHKASLGEEIKAHSEDSGVEKEVYKAAFNALNEHLGEEFDIRQVELGGWDALIKPFLKTAKLEAELAKVKAKTERSTEDSKRAAKAVSPTSLSTKPVSDIPIWVKEKRDATEKELLALTKKQAAEMGFDL